MGGVQKSLDPANLRAACHPQSSLSFTARPVTHRRPCLALQLMDLFVEGDHLGFGLQLEFSEAGLSCVLLTLE